jgi:hypothetical protein
MQYQATVRVDSLSSGNLASLTGKVDWSGEGDTVTLAQCGIVGKVVTSKPEAREVVVAVSRDDYHKLKATEQFKRLY